MYAADLDTYRMNKKERTDATEKEKELTGKKQFLSHAAKRRNKKDNGSTNTEKLKHKPMNMLLPKKADKRAEKRDGKLRSVRKTMSDFDMARGDAVAAALEELALQVGRGEARWGLGVGSRHPRPACRRLSRSRTSHPRQGIDAKAVVTAADTGRCVRCGRGGAGTARIASHAPRHALPAIQPRSRQPPWSPRSRRAMPARATQRRAACRPP